MNQTIVRRIRLHRKNSAFVYAILESLEGWVSFSTLDTLWNGDSNWNTAFRDLELYIPKDFEQDVAAVIESFQRWFEVIYLDGALK